MSELAHRRITPSALAALVEDAPDAAVLSDEHRATLASRFRSVAAANRTMLDAWAVEAAGQPSEPFRWRPVNARRVIGNAALRRLRLDGRFTVTSAVRDEVDELLVRSAAGYSRVGSLSHWLAAQPAAVVSLVIAEAVTWATNTLEPMSPTGLEWTPVPTDAYYDVAGARTTLRGRRDVVVGDPADRVLIRFRAGQPGRFAGAGLRADLVSDALADPFGRAPRRIIGLWPDAGVLLAVDGQMEDLRAGARDLVRAAVAKRRLERVLAA